MQQANTNLCPDNPNSFLGVPFSASGRIRSGSRQSLSPACERGKSSDKGSIPNATPLCGTDTDSKTIIKKQINDTVKKSNGVCFIAMNNKGRYSIKG